MLSNSDLLFIVLGRLGGGDVSPAWKEGARQLAKIPLVVARQGFSRLANMEECVPSTAEALR